LHACIACGGRRRAAIGYPLPGSVLFRNLTVAICQDCGFGTTLYLARQDFWPEAKLLAVEPDASMLGIAFSATVGPARRRGLRDRVNARIRRLTGKSASEYGGDRAALRLLAR
jgi:hypothetical protein